METIRSQLGGILDKERAKNNLALQPLNRAQATPAQRAAKLAFIRQRNAAGKSIVEASKEAGISQSTYNRWLLQENKSAPAPIKPPKRRRHRTWRPLSERALIAQNAKELLHSGKALTQEHAAGMLKVNPSTLSAWLHGKNLGTGNGITKGAPVLVRLDDAIAAFSTSDSPMEFENVLLRGLLK